MSQEIINQARTLADLIATSQELKNLRDTEVKLANDPVAQELVKEYQTWQAKEAEAQQQGGELSQQDKETYDNVEKQMENNATISAYLDAQADFSDLMESINYLIMKGISGDTDSCDSGSCGGCSGCGH